MVQIGGTVIGAALGGAGALSGGDFWTDVGSGAWTGALTGGIAGGASMGAMARAMDQNPWTGRLLNPTPSKLFGKGIHSIYPPPSALYLLPPTIQLLLSNL